MLSAVEHLIKYGEKSEMKGIPTSQGLTCDLQGFPVLYKNKKTNPSPTKTIPNLKLELRKKYTSFTTKLNALSRDRNTLCSIKHLHIAPHWPEKGILNLGAHCTADLAACMDLAWCCTSCTVFVWLPRMCMLQHLAHSG